MKTESGSLLEGKVRIRLEHDGTMLDVDEDDVEKVRGRRGDAAVRRRAELTPCPSGAQANPPSYSRCEDLASLLYLNESSVLHSLRQRYGGNLIYTHAGPNMVVINPLSTPSMYSEKVTPPAAVPVSPWTPHTSLFFPRQVMHMFKGCRREDSAPHIYAVAQSAYRNLLTTRQDQSVVLLGKSGSGKTTNCQHLVQYLVSIAGSTGKIFSGESSRYPGDAAASSADAGVSPPPQLRSGRRSTPSWRPSGTAPAP